jgi:addiction module HigA family antidote
VENAAAAACGLSYKDATIKQCETMAKKPKHPGTILQDIYLSDLGMNGNALAAALQVPGERISSLLRGQASIDADLSIRLGRYFSKEPGYWLALQSAYELAKAEAETDYSGIDKHPGIVAFFP